MFIIDSLCLSVTVHILFFSPVNVFLSPDGLKLLQIIPKLGQKWSKYKQKITLKIFFLIYHACLLMDLDKILHGPRER